MDTNFSDQILGYPKYATSHNIDLSKIVTLSALVEPDSNLSKLKEKIERLKFQIAGQQQEIFLLKKSKLRFSNSVALNEEVQLVKKINSDLRAKVLELSKMTRDYEVKLQLSIHEISKIEEKLRSALQENIELKLQLHNNKNLEKHSKANLVERDSICLATEIRDLKKQVSLMKDHLEKSMINVTPNSRSNVSSTHSSIPKWTSPKISDGMWTKSTQSNKSHVYEKLNNPIVRPKKICGRMINSHLNKDTSKTICVTSKTNLKSQIETLSKKSDESSVKSDSSDESSESSSSSNQSNLSENQSDITDSNNTTRETSKEHIIDENNDEEVDIIEKHNNDKSEKGDKKSEINQTKSDFEEQDDEELQQTTNLLLDIPRTCEVKNYFDKNIPRSCEVKNYFEKISDNEVD